MGFSQNQSKKACMFPESCVNSLAVRTPHMDKQCSYSYAKDLLLNAERQHIWCTSALIITNIALLNIH